MERLTDFLETGIVRMSKTDPTSLRTALTISLDMQILPDLLCSSVLVDFSLDLAMLASQENVLTFENWVLEFLTINGVCHAHNARIDHVASSEIPVDEVLIILRCLINCARRSDANQEKEFIEGVQAVYEFYCHRDQRIIDYAPAVDVGIA